MVTSSTEDAPADTLRNLLPNGIIQPRPARPSQYGGGAALTGPVASQALPLFSSGTSVSESSDGGLLLT
jgi:hypothetical protein